MDARNRFLEEDLIAEQKFVKQVPIDRFAIIRHPTVGAAHVALISEEYSEIHHSSDGRTRRVEHMYP
jgi:hypothetical protein